MSRSAVWLGGQAPGSGTAGLQQDGADRSSRGSDVTPLSPRPADRQVPERRWATAGCGPHCRPHGRPLLSSAWVTEPYTHTGGETRRPGGWPAGSGPRDGAVHLTGQQNPSWVSPSTPRPTHGRHPPPGGHPESSPCSRGQWRLKFGQQGRLTVPARQDPYGHRPGPWLASGMRGGPASPCTGAREGLSPPPLRVVSSPEAAWQHQEADTRGHPRAPGPDRSPAVQQRGPPRTHGGPPRASDPQSMAHAASAQCQGLRACVWGAPGPDPSPYMPGSPLQ